MTNQHPIPSPPDALVRQWQREANHNEAMFPQVAIKAAQWGADQELQACINFVYDNELCDPDFYNNLRNARRPKPPTDKELALRELGDAYDKGKIDDTTYDAIRKALEQLND
jgi:hypothetical protein